MKSYFSQSEETKCSIAVDTNRDIGYFEFPSKECLKLRPPHKPNIFPWTSFSPSLLAAFYGYFGLCESLANDIFKNLSQHVSLDKTSIFDNSTMCGHFTLRHLQKKCEWCKAQSWMQLLHYFPTNEAHLIAPTHTDSSILTLAFPQTIGGLEISIFGEQPSFVDIEKHCAPNEIVVFGGSKLESLTKDSIYALPHRVMSVPCIDRYSAPFKFDCTI